MGLLDFVEDLVRLPIDIARDTVKTVRGDGPLQTGESDVIDRLKKISADLDKVIHED